MHQIRVTVPSGLDHNSQIVAGFLMLKQQGWDIRVEDCSHDEKHPFHGMAIVQAEYLGKTILYDLWDGYQCAEQMKNCLEGADYYFKRSFSREKNGALFPSKQHKMYPLGFNYHVTFFREPFAEPVWKAAAKTLLGRVPERYFVPARFEGKAKPADGPAKILFLTRLWDDHDPALTEEENRERSCINEMRIRIIRSLRQCYGEHFLGGLQDMPLARELAPDLIIPEIYTQRKRYLKRMHRCDICIGSMGLHESIGWKTGEYVAAAKAIVNEELHYEVPGDFREGSNCLSFTTVSECMEAVRSLAEDPDRLLAMKRANESYYREYLRPDVLVRNTLRIVEAHETGK